MSHSYHNTSGIALPLVLGLLLVVSLIGAGLMSQTITSTKFYEAAGVSYLRLWNENNTGALQELDKPANAANLLAGKLTTAIVKDQNDTIVTVLYAIPSGNGWTPDWDEESKLGSVSHTWTIIQQQPPRNSTIRSALPSTAIGNREDIPYLFKKTSDRLKCWDSYNLHIEFRFPPVEGATGTSPPALSPRFGVYYNSNSTSSNVSTNPEDEGFQGNLFVISPKDGTFTIYVSNPGETPPGQRYPNPPLPFDDSSIKGPKGNNPFSGWKNATSSWTGLPFDGNAREWHTIDIYVQSEGKGSVMTTIISVDEVPVLKDTTRVRPNLVPDFVGLSNGSDPNWGNPLGTSHVEFGNISVVDMTPCR